MSFSQPLPSSYLVRREANILNTFSPFSLRPTGCRPGYETVQKCERNDIQFYSNLPEHRLRQLRI